MPRKVYPSLLCMCVCVSEAICTPGGGGGSRRQPRTLFLRSVDAALECMLIYFGMESTYLYDSEVAGKRLL